jgi:hypothetical protein
MVLIVVSNGIHRSISRIIRLPICFHVPKYFVVAQEVSTCRSNCPFDVKVNVSWYFVVTICRAFQYHLRKNGPRFLSTEYSFTRVLSCPDTEASPQNNSVMINKLVLIYKWPTVESPKGVAPLVSHRTVCESLPSHGESAAMVTNIMLAAVPLILFCYRLVSSNVK